MPNALDAIAESKHRVLMLGDTGTGKTTQFLTLPGKKFIYLFDSNALLTLRGQDIDYEEWLPDKLNISAGSLSKGKGDLDSGARSTIYRDWEVSFNEKLRSGFFDSYDVIGFDSATTLLDLIMDRILANNGRAGAWPNLDDYGPQMVAFVNICRTVVSLGKTIYFTGHLDVKQDELTQRIFRRPLMTGKLVTKIPLLFSDIFYTSVDTDAAGKIIYNIQTTPDRMNTTIRSSVRGLDPVENVTLDWTQPLVGQGLGGIFAWELKQLGGT